MRDDRSHQAETSALAPIRLPPIADGAVTQAATGVRHNLPSRLTNIVGRGSETAEVVALLGTHRLVTLAGSPGVGKTRLGLQVESSQHLEIRRALRDDGCLEAPRPQRFRSRARRCS